MSAKKAATKTAKPAAKRKAPAVRRVRAKAKTKEKAAEVQAEELALKSALSSAPAVEAQAQAEPEGEAESEAGGEAGGEEEGDSGGDEPEGVLSSEIARTSIPELPPLEEFEDVAPDEAPAPLPPPPKLTDAERRARVDALMLGAREALRRVFRFGGLRPGQEPVLRSVFEGRDTFAIMPTGSGKSLTYQLPALVLPGTTFVVSPLLALIEDQVGKLRRLGIPVARIDSTITQRERNAELSAIRKGERKIVFITPEGITSASVREALAGVRPSLLVIDEAHCISQWGHDFRPAYVALRHSAIDLGRPPILALTATATPQVADDVLLQLGVTDARTFRRSFYRPNLYFEVRHHDSEGEKLRTVGKLIRRLRRPGIIYCATVRAVDDLYAALRRGGIPVLRYHGRMTRDEREESQGRFMQPGKRLVMLATNAFGLGVDKPDVRFVLHFHLPGSPEAYTQEAGRAGRDGRPSRCILLDAPDDVKIQEYFLADGQPTKHEARRVVEALYAWSDEGRPVGARDLATSASLPERRVRTILAALEELGIAAEADARWSGVDPRPTREQLLRAAATFEKRRIADRRHLDEILAYIRTVSCRSIFLRQYFGEDDVRDCGYCDGCRAKGIVRHPAFARPDFDRHGGEESRGRRRGRGRGRGRGEAWARHQPQPARPSPGFRPPAASLTSEPWAPAMPWSLAEAFPAFGLVPR